MRILALDLGTKTGYACGQGSDYTCGTRVLATAEDITAAGKARMDRRLDPRIPTLFAWLKSMLPLDWVLFEDVEFSKFRLQTQLWASFRACVWIFAAEHGVKIECCPVGTLKSFGANHGGATKEMMMSALVRTDSRFIFRGKVVIDTVTGISLTDDAVDAIHLLKWGQKILSNYENRN